MRQFRVLAQPKSQILALSTQIGLRNSTVRRFGPTLKAEPSYILQFLASQMRQYEGFGQPGPRPGLAGAGLALQAPGTPVARPKLCHCSPGSCKRRHCRPPVAGPHSAIAARVDAAGPPVASPRSAIAAPRPAARLRACRCSPCRRPWPLPLQPMPTVPVQPGARSCSPCPL